MSNYRDDSTDLAVASDSTWLGLSAITESAARIAAVLLVAIGVTHVDAATAADEAADRRIFLTRQPIGGSSWSRMPRKLLMRRRTGCTLRYLSPTARE